jgi:hypothetical protein
MNKKLVILVLALILPGLIFLFLKFFGSNHFDIPVYHQNGIENLPAGCRASAKEQYRLPDSLMKLIRWNHGAALIYTGVSSTELKELSQALENINRADLQRVNLDSAGLSQPDETKKCTLFLQEPWNAVLVDNQNRIRGYYSLRSREEFDRLGIEVEILLTKP